MKYYVDIVTKEFIKLNPHLHPKKGKKESNDTIEEIAMTSYHCDTSEKELDFDVASSNEECLAYSSLPTSSSELKGRQITALNKHVYSAFLNKTNWILDSGATTYICCDKSLFKEIKTTNVQISGCSIRKR